MKYGLAVESDTSMIAEEAFVTGFYHRSAMFRGVVSESCNSPRLGTPNTVVVFKLIADEDAHVIVEA